MKKRAVFFDRDNTLIRNDGYLGDPGGVILMDGAAAAVARAHELGYFAVVVSNQSGVARGMFTEDNVRAVNERMDQLLLQADPRARIDRHEFCPFHPEAIVERYRRESELRKPRPGMILQAAAALNLDLAASWIIGDAVRDVLAGKAAGCRAILLSPPGPPVCPEADAIVPDLRHAMEFLAAH
jgi:D,D-heptose 1,7-bisphosphate phosphatase